MRIVVGMSGGVDSSLAAYLLKEQGHEVIGMTLKLYAYDASMEETAAQKQHCHPDDFIYRAQEVARHLGIDHHVLDRQSLFQETIVDSFLQAYQKGKTPIPCASCNRDVKTALMIQMMRDVGADAVATGHYARHFHGEGGSELHQGLDTRQDQSFFLFALRYEHVQKLYFPLGGYTKKEAREKAAAIGLKSADTPASQDLCFIEKGSYRTLFAPQPGDIYHMDGRLMGQHHGVARYTIGQRQGLNLGGMTDPLYVLHVDAAANNLIVGPYEALACSAFSLQEVNWMAPDHQSLPTPDNERHTCKASTRDTADDQDQGNWMCHNIEVKIRSGGKKIPALLRLSPDTLQGKITLKEVEYGVSPGQVCVFYQGTRVLGGGWISQAETGFSQNS